MKIVIHQPNLFPRLKVLQKIAVGDLWVILDDVQFVKREWQNRALIRFFSQPLQTFWLTIPVHLKNGQRTAINQAETTQPEYVRKKIAKSLYIAYKNSAHWPWIEQYLELILPELKKNTCEFNIFSTLKVFELLGLEIKTTHSSVFRLKSKKTQRLVDLCSRLQGDVYLSGSGGKKYLDQSLFGRQAIEVAWQQWRPPRITEQDSLDWREISFLDFIARYGPDCLCHHLLKEADFEISS